MKKLTMLVPAAALLLAAACGSDNSSSRRAATPSAATTVAVVPSTTTAAPTTMAASTTTAAPAPSGPSYSTKTFVFPLDVTVPAFLPAAPSVDQPNFVTWETTDLVHAVRFLAPVNLYQPGAATATRVPSDYSNYLRGLKDHGAHFSDVLRTTVGGTPATIMTGTTDGSLDGVLGCPGEGVAAPDCFGLQPDLSLRIAVLDVADQPLLIWLRRPLTDNSPDTLDSFNQMLASVRFSDRAVELPAAASTAPTPIDGVWTASWTFEDLQSSPLLYDSGELNDTNWGQMTLTFHAGQYSLNVTNPKLTTSYHGTFEVDGDTLTIVDGTQKFVMHWNLSTDELTLGRDTALGIAPTPLVIRPWAHQG
jgi:hypothetical protein